MEETTKNNETTETVKEKAKEEIKTEKESKKEKSHAEHLEAKHKAEMAEADKKYEALKAELDAANDKYLRLYAEFDNFRRRATKEREASYTDATADVITEILPIIDNLERAAQFTETEKVSEGIGMILKSAKDALAKLGVAEIEAAGKQFDPNVHNAVMREDCEGAEENTVTDVLQKGYTKGDKVIRYAMVKVAN